MENFSVQLLGVIHWLPSHKPGRVQFPPDTPFRISVRFTSDFAPIYSAVVIYLLGPDTSGRNPVRLSFPFENKNRIAELARNSEILLMDGYKVIAVCRELTPLNTDIRIGHPWD